MPSGRVQRSSMHSSCGKWHSGSPRWASVLLCLRSFGAAAQVSDVRRDPGNWLKAPTGSDILDAHEWLIFHYTVAGLAMLFHVFFVWQLKKDIELVQSPILS